MRYVLIFVFILFTVSMKAQTLEPAGLCSTAGSFSNSAGRLEFNAGEPLTQYWMQSSSQISNGTLQPPFAVASVPITQLRSVDCGKLNLTPDAQFAAVPVAGAFLYEFEFRLPGSLSVYAIRISPYYAIATGSVTPALNWNTQYEVRVRVQVSGVWGNFGNACLIGLMQNPAITGVPNTQLRPPFCNSSVGLTSSVSCFPVSMGNRYEFLWTNTVTGTTHTYTSLTNQCPVALVSPALQAGVTYQVQARGRVYTTWGNWGPVCTVNLNTAFAGARDIAIDTNQVENDYSSDLNYNSNDKLNVWPNPSMDWVNVQYESEFEESVTFTLFDMQGRILFATTGKTNQPLLISYLNDKIENSASYFLRATNQNGHTLTQVIIHNNN